MGTAFAVVGAGQLGRRHLQGLAAVPGADTIHVVDASPASLAAARDAATAWETRAEFLWSESVEALPQRLDYVVVATTADVRLSVLERLVPGRRIGGLLLEKVLFQRLADYATATTLLEDVPTWVDCPRRDWDIYRQVREFFDGEKLLEMDVVGGEWGLGCNAVHFLDLVQFIGGMAPSAVRTDELDPTAIEAKRPGFKEFTGTLGATSGSTRLRLTSVRGSSDPLVIRLSGARRSASIRESGGLAVLADENGAMQEIRFRAPYLSEQSGELARLATRSGAVPLPSLAESVRCHLPLVSALAEFADRTLGTEAGLAPIT